MKPSLKRLILPLALVAAGALMPTGSAKAAGTGLQGITVSPAYQQISIPVGAAKQPAVFSITNDQTKPQTLDLSVADFNTLSETGGLFFVGANPTQLQKTYGLAKWVSLPENKVTIPAKTTIQLKAEILDLSTLAPGGHYGALMLAIDNGGSQSNKVSLHPIASSLLFVTKLDGATYKLDLTNVNVKRAFAALPSSVELRFENIGNTHLIPRGVITVTNSKGTIISKGIINENSQIILPQTYRLYNVPMSAVSTPKMPGEYNLTINYRFDGYNGYRTYRTSLFVIPTVDAVVGGCVIIIIFVAVGWKIRRRPGRNNTSKPAPAKKIKIKILE